MVDLPISQSCAVSERLLFRVCQKTLKILVTYAYKIQVKMFYVAYCCKYQLYCKELHVLLEIRLIYIILCEIVSCITVVMVVHMQTGPVYNCQSVGAVKQKITKSEGQGNKCINDREKYHMRVEGPPVGTAKKTEVSVPLKLDGTKKMEIKTKNKENCESTSPLQNIFSVLFQFHRLKIKQQPFIYYNTAAHPIAVRGITWSKFDMEIYRLCSFANYPISCAKSAYLLAAQGFVYIGNGANDKVVCFFCGKEKQDWRLEDVIEEVHRLISPDCPQVTRAIANTDQGITPASFEGACYSSESITTGPLTNSSSLPSPLNENIAEDSNHLIPHSPPSQNFTSRQLAQNEQYNQTDFASLIQNNISGELETPVLEDQIALSSSLQDETTEIENAFTETISSTARLTSPSSITSGIQNTQERTFITITETHNSALQTVRNDDIIDRGPTYSDLGIVTDRPKRPEFALRMKRLETFASWPRCHHLTPEELVEAGFFFAGFGDCARCFYCGGGLRNWDEEDNVWVEHARWFPKCYYIRQKVGQEFIDAVQDLHLQLDQITIDQIRQRLDPQSSFLTLDNEDTSLQRDPAVSSVLLLGFCHHDVIETAKVLKQEDDFLSADTLIEKLETEGKQNDHRLVIPYTSENIQKDIDLLRTLKERNRHIRQQISCKICLDKDVSVVFLPCGHLVSCGDCSSAMRDCPVCRTHVRGVTRAIIA